jgi:hypothetical protein
MLVLQVAVVTRSMHMRCLLGRSIRLLRLPYRDSWQLTQPLLLLLLLLLCNASAAHPAICISHTQDMRLQPDGAQRVLLVDAAPT